MGAYTAVDANGELHVYSDHPIIKGDEWANPHTSDQFISDQFICEMFEDKCVYWKETLVEIF